MRNRLLEHPEETAWWCYLIVHCADQKLIGTCGYKGLPTSEHQIEIGYEIADGYQGQGLAAEAAGALIEQAFSHPAVRSVIAHTLAEENASVAVLRKLGFSFGEERLDAENGRI